MKRLLIFLFSLVYVASYAQSDIITAAEAAKIIKNNKNVRIIDASKAKLYNAAHLKNAINISAAEVVNNDEIPGLLKSPEELSKLFGSKGISEKNEIIVYDEGSQKYSSRIYWVLKYLGAGNVKILHKDNNAWRKARLVQTAKKPFFKKTVFNVKLNKSIYASMDEVEKSLKNPAVKIVDARSPDDYNGKTETSDGHIPGAVNLFFKDVLTSTNAFKSKDELQKLATAKGITPDKEIIVYCMTGVKASVVFVALKEVLGYKNVKLYDGAYEEWWANYKPLVK